MADWDHERDIVVVGSGAGGMLATLVALERGQRPLLIEKEARWGGSSAWSGGGMWMPNNPLMARDGVEDSPEAALAYMNAIIADGPWTTPEHKERFIDQAPEVVRYLEARGFPFLRADAYPDYHPEEPGGRIGRAVEVEVFDGRALGAWHATISRQEGVPGVAMTTRDTQHLPVALRTWRGLRGTLRVLLRTAWMTLTGKKVMGIGQALAGRLMHALQERGAEVWLSSPLVELVEEEGRVTGVVVERAGRRERIGAKIAVLLTAGGFARSEAMRLEHQGVTGAWSSASPGNTGDVILAGTRIEAATGLMEDAWWGPTFLMPPDDTPAFAVYERSMPGCILVDPQGKRFANESASYVDVGHAMLALNPGGPPPPTWLILDARHRRRYLMGFAPPRLTPRSWFTSGFMKQADSLRALAARCGIDPDGLEATVERYNTHARRGEDPDFHRGASAYDRYYGDASNAPHPNLLPIEQGPFYACQMVAGDLGTKGGLLCDPHARVLRRDGSVIAGLYASGNVTASVMGDRYPGPGSTLGPAMTFAFIAANHAIDAHGEEA